MNSPDSKQPAADKPETTGSTAAKPRTRRRSAKTTRDNILRAAKKIFSKEGYEGARVDTISKAAKSYDSLIYYYFGSKEKLFIEVLQNAYKDMFEAEKNLPLDLEDPVGALRKFVEFPLRYYVSNPEILTLLGTENLQKGKHISKSRSPEQYSLPAIAILQDIVAKGVEKGLFRENVDCRKLYIAMTALGYFYVSNRYTFSAFLSHDLMQADNIEDWAGYVSDLLVNSISPAKR
ncbi:TetR/AcrR family transcriptional regulator [Pusillimonas sp. CC-YST705]|uniref:TetR/AcrR family transcriptional regulator n=1 Tax=Mesopusillimonas faecipullorum TaxID=2755040 RepID=A0ABS8CCB6_9BURK|nr:TetR/AcrR family transcriptional regulator [Mesopusillimonas faecipullorum]MCB5363670.1 TetR/AcrR family transcriptional regulator [Mesopusillimonas faecipullorum]